MRILVLLFFMLFCCLCCAKTPEITGIMRTDKAISTQMLQTEPMRFGIIMPPISPESIIIKAGDGRIRIHFDGKVEIENATLDKAAQEFWEKVAAAFPQFKENILREAAAQATIKEGGFFVTVPGNGL